MSLTGRRGPGEGRGDRFGRHEKSTLMGFGC